MPDDPFGAFDPAELQWLLPWLAMTAGLLLDRMLGEPRRWHPLVGFGRWGAWVEALARRWGSHRAAGMLAWCGAVMPWLALALALREWLAPLPWAAWLLDALLLYFAVGLQSLGEHAEAVIVPLQRGELDAARARVGWLVSRDTSQLDAEGVARAGTESVLENGNDAVFGALLWFLIAGGAGALLFRLANTLDAMWGYRTPRFVYFGWAAARIDDLLNYPAARLTALSYALLGRTRTALACWHRQAPHWDSPNAGPVMAAGAGALGVTLGGAAVYHGRREERPILGAGLPPSAASLEAALRLVRRAVRWWLWLALPVLGLIHA